MSITSEARTHWQGSVTDGSGQTHMQSSGAASFDVTWAARSTGELGRTDPEDLLGAAHSACYSWRPFPGLTKKSSTALPKRPKPAASFRRLSPVCPSPWRPVCGNSSFFQTRKDSAGSHFWCQWANWHAAGPDSASPWPRSPHPGAQASSRCLRTPEGPEQRPGGPGAHRLRRRSNQPLWSVYLPNSLDAGMEKSHSGFEDPGHRDVGHSHKKTPPLPRLL